MRLALALLLPLSAMVRSTCTTAYPGVDTELAQARYLGEPSRPSPALQFGAHAGAYHPWSDPANAPAEPPALQAPPLASAPPAGHVAPVDHATQPVPPGGPSAGPHGGPTPAMGAPSAGVPSAAPEGPAAPSGAPPAH